MTYSVIYVIRSNELSAHKIGVTNNWSQRKRQLEVGIKAEPVHVVRVHDAGKLETFLHRRFKAKRLPQSEWFLNLDCDELSFVRATLLKAKDDYDRARERQPTPVSIPASNRPQPKWYADHLAARERAVNRSPRPVPAATTELKRGNCLAAKLVNLLLGIAIAFPALYVLAAMVWAFWPVLAVLAVGVGIAWLMNPRSEAHT
jgi:hypothetical protein